MHHRFCSFKFKHWPQGLSFPAGSEVKNLPASAGDSGDWVRSLRQEDPLEKEMGTHSSILAWKISWREEPSGPQSVGL